MREVIERMLGGYESGRVSRRELILSLSALALGAGGVGAGEAGSAGAPSAPGAAGESPRGAPGADRGVQGSPFRARTLNHATLFVSDVERSVEFYRGLFGMPVRSRQENGVNLAAGPQNQFLGLYGASGGAEPGIHHVCLGMEDFDAQAALDTLAEEGIEGRIRMRGETPELYFPDPDGIMVQIQDLSYCGGGGVLGDEC